MINLNKINTINWEKQNICILGAGKSGLGAAKLANHLKANVLLSDIVNKKIDIDETDKFKYEPSGHSNKILKYDLIVKSPGIPNETDILQRCLKEKMPIVSEIEFASWFSNSKSIAITGSNGKTTTANLVYDIFKNTGLNVLLGGNIGTPYSENVLYELQNDNDFLHIVEISSYQAEHLIHYKPFISCILNISEDHLDRYKTMDEYIDAKLNIAKNLSKESKLVYNADDFYLSKKIKSNNSIIPFSIIKNSNSQIYYEKGRLTFKDDDSSYDLSNVDLIGIHNIYNIIAASTIAVLYGINHSKIIDTLNQFMSLPHRIEYVTEINGAKYINDSKSTNIASTMAAVHCFKNIILIIGGQPKGKINIEDLIILAKQKNIKNIIIYGDIINSLKNKLNKYNNIYSIYFFQDAVTKSIEISSVDDYVLLSPAFSSFDQFKNYKERGKTFKKILKKYTDVK